MIKAHAFWMYGMWGPVTDPGSCQMSHRIAMEVGADIHGSPYRDYDVNQIVDAILALPEDAPVIVGGTSLGANNTPIVAAYVYLKNPKRKIHGIWAFQASVYGAKAYPGTAYQGVTPNVQFAHLMSSDNPINMGLGAYRWVQAPGAHIPGWHLDTNRDPHPGDSNVSVQGMYLAEMKRVVASATS